MKNHRFPWLRNRTTDNRKCEKARNIKEKCTIEMFSTVSKQLVALRSSASVNLFVRFYTTVMRPGYFSWAFFVSEEGNQATAQLSFGFTRTYNEKIRKHGVRLMRSGRIFEYERGRKP